MVKRTTHLNKGRRRSESTSLGSGLGPMGRGLLGRMFRGRREPRELPTHHEATSIAIASGKGGTGKSFFATNLAVILHRQLERVALADCDFGLACSHLLMGVTPDLTTHHLLAGQARLQDICVRTPAGPTLIPGGSGIMQLADLTDQQLLMLARMFADIAATQDILLLDVGAGIAPQNVLTLLAADHVIMVTNAELAALTDAYAVIKCCARLRPDIDISIVVNRVMAPGQGLPTFEKLAKVTHRHTKLDLSYLGEVPEDPTVTHRRLGQQPLAVTEPNGPAASGIVEIARRLGEVVQPMGRRQVNEESGIRSRFQKHRLFMG